MIKKIGLDFGHGGKDTGAIGNGLVEKNVVLNIGLLLNKRLKEHGMITVLSRKNDRYVSLSDRVKIFNDNNVEIVVSLHVNSFNKKSANGFESYITTNQAHNKHKKGSYANNLNLCRKIHNSIANDKLFRTNRGLKNANFTVISKTKSPAILLELGFISNYEDSNVLKNDINKIVESLAKAILTTCGIKYIPNNYNKNKGYYRVITGSYKNKSNAEKQVNKLKKLGIDSFIAYYEK